MSELTEQKPMWRSLDDLAGTPEFREFTAKEFPGFANVFESIGEAELAEPDAADHEFNRRQFVALSAAALGLAGLAGCRRPDLQILPYSQTPDFIVPGIPLYYATSLPRPGGCFPVLVESHEGRPTKIEGNPKHPASMGATDSFAQAAVLDLYSPDRSKQVLRRIDGRLQPKSWEEFDVFASDHFEALKKNQGEGLAFLIEDHPSPALRELREHLKKKFSSATWYVHEPISTANNLAGAALAFGTPLIASHNFEHAHRVVSLDCDFLGLDGNMVQNGRGFSTLKRDPSLTSLFGQKHEHEAHGKDHHHDAAKEMSRLYVLENTYTVTGTLADHRLRIPSAHVVDYSVALAKEIVGRTGVTTPAEIKTALEKIPAPGVVLPEHWIKEVATDLIEFKGKSLILAGSRQPALVHALCHLMNEILGNTGHTVTYRPLAAPTDAGLGDLVKAIDAGKIKTLIVAGGNAAYTAPADLDFAKALGNVPTLIRLGLFVDETSEPAAWHLPMAHTLESWGDAETADGTYSSIQPLIAPLHGGRSLLELLVMFSAYERATNYADAKIKIYTLLKNAFAKRTEKDDDLSFKRFVHEGFFPESARKPDNRKLDGDGLAFALRLYQPAATISAKNREISFHPDYSLFDGRYAWNGWMMEFPDPITKLVWDNAALVSMKTAKDLQVKQGDMLEIETGDTVLKIPAFILPGQADDSISLPLGYGKLRLSRVAEGGGFDVYPLRTSGALYFTTGAVTKTKKTYELVTTQEHGTIPKDKDADIIRDYTLADVEKNHAAHSAANEHGAEGEKKHYADDPKTRFQWGYDQSSYKDAGPSMRDIKRIALSTAEDVSFPQRLDGYMQWGMVIDLNTCTGCSACVVACQSENNIPIVGKGEVKRNREMHWISLHRYFMTKEDVVKGGLESPPAEDPRIISQPMMCQHCEAAPCESVCPVNATVHSPEGLNLQVYNRCIGTRYCSNNCPYKARRFNWFDFNKRRIDELRVPTPFSEAGMPETLKMQKNPEVTVRMRGVMEKCTYCIQRIERARIGSKVLAIKAGHDKVDTKPTADAKQEYKQGYAIRVYDGASRIVVPDGIVKTACSQACPTGSIVFGNVRDEKSQVHAIKNAAGGPDYLVLGSLNTKPRTSYLPRLRNLNPKMMQGGRG